jgi:hypothetical protein
MRLIQPASTKSEVFQEGNETAGCSLKTAPFQEAKMYLYEYSAANRIGEFLPHAPENILLETFYIYLQDVRPGAALQDGFPSGGHMYGLTIFSAVADEAEAGAVRNRVDVQILLVSSQRQLERLDLREAAGIGCQLPECRRERFKCHHTAGLADSLRQQPSVMSHIGPDIPYTIARENSIE